MKMKLRLSDSFFVLMIKHVREFCLQYSGAMLSLIALNYFQAEIPQLAKRMGELATEGKLEELSLGYFFFLAVAILFFRTLSRLLFFHPARTQQKYLRNEFVWRMSQTPPSKYSGFTSGDLYQTLFSDVNRIRGFVGFALLQLGNIIVALTIFIPKIMEVNSKLLLAFLPFIIGMVIFTIVVAFFAPLERKATDLQAKVQHFLIESFQGRGTVKNFNVEESFISKFSELSWNELKVFFKSSIGVTFAAPIIRLSLGASFLWGAYIVESQDLGASTLIFFSGFLFLLFEPLMFLSWVGVIASGAWASWKRIKKLVDATELEDVSKRSELKIDFKDSIKIWNKGFDFNYTLNSRNVVCGDTGSGKSYLLEELAKKLVDRKLRYSMVFQEPYLYNDSLEKNIFLGKVPTKTERALAKKLLKVFFLDEVLELEDFWNLELGENGKRLSGGQAKRLVLVQSLLSESRVLLWDDPFSSVDVIQEKAIWDSLASEELFKDRVLIYSAHRYSSVVVADTITFIKKEDAQCFAGKSSDLLIPGKEVYEYFKEQFI